jgi:hypothetical protein
MDGELIVVSIISLIGTIIIASMFNANWFKRENFKLQKQNILAENRVKYKKLEREMGLNTRPAAPDLSQLLPLASQFLKSGGGAAEEILEEPDGITGALLDYATSHPEIIQSLAKGFLDKTKQNSAGANESNFM